VRGNATSAREPELRIWNEIFESDGSPRAPFRPLLERLATHSRGELRALTDRVEATLREMGVRFNVRLPRVQGPRDWICDLLPQVFEQAEWERVERGLRQRLEAFEAFLWDIHGPRHILRDGTLPVAPVLGSPYYEPAAAGLVPARGAFLHLGGIALARDRQGRLCVKNHYFSNASGISYMMQNRRALARVVPGWFDGEPVLPIADAPLGILEELRGMMPDTLDEPTVVLLTPGVFSASYSEHTMLARRMGIPLVQGSDLVVLDDRVYLKTIKGLERVEAIYRRISDTWLDPLVFDPSSVLGVPGLVHCIRKGTVAVVNGIGSQLADDRALLPLAPRIIRYYLNETPLLPTIETRWLGDPDQRDLVLDDPDAWRIRPLYGERVLVAGNGVGAERAHAAIAREVLRAPHRFVAQTVAESAATVCLEGGRPVERLQDHLVFALRRPDGFEVFPGALTRVSAPGGTQTASELGGRSKDTWVLATGPRAEMAARTAPAPEIEVPAHAVTSRVAEGFYWLGRYLERAWCLSHMVGTIEALETEELNSAERKLFRPVWNRVLPPLETPGAGARGRRSISTWLDRYCLTLQPDQPGSVASILHRAFTNADSLQDVLSPEAWAPLADLRARFGNGKFRPQGEEAFCTRETRRLCDAVTRLVPMFAGLGEATMLADDGWRFCVAGQAFERAVVTANALSAFAEALAGHLDAGPGSEVGSELELSAFLRLLGTRDAYRRVYQMRAAPAEVLEILIRHPGAPRSVARCLGLCRRMLAETFADGPEPPACTAIDALLRSLALRDYREWFGARGPQDLLLPDENRDRVASLGEVLKGLLADTLEVHTRITDGFAGHRERIGRTRNLGRAHAV
jgi:uncharacterized circularly permuted ATP-grasp superfamily protein/uncharacterized alpha-E superfamily protein